ncbi:prolipoprotein diacylglyceryl transferase family protein [Coxiella burnetii]|uniref:prolipoprotein diacylglyceryl transferase family protein n=1 Tax=Coxiella burnetii TaxID=777 RepID=UPI001ED9322B|nr:prolipoprotein diacylglyceryl transferase family protein [Coxiella burnetii]
MLNRLPAFKLTKKTYFASFGIFSAIAVLLGISLIVYLLKLNFPSFGNYEEYWLLIIPFWTVVMSKLFHIVVTGSAFWKHPLEQLRSTTFYAQGGIIGGFIGFINYAWVTNIPFTVIIDIGFTAGCLALAIARLGCYNYGCCHGLPTKGKFYVTYENRRSKVLRIHPELKGVHLYPTQLVSSLFNFLLFMALLIVYQNITKSGIIGSLGLILYSVFRLCISRFRSNDDEKIAVVKENKIFFRTAISFIIASFAILIYMLLFPTYQYTHSTNIGWRTFNDLVIQDGFIFLYGYRGIYLPNCLWNPSGQAGKAFLKTTSTP